LVDGVFRVGEPPTGWGIVEEVDTLVVVRWALSGRGSQRAAMLRGTVVVCADECTHITLSSTLDCWVSV
jgi:hypothetical protein